MNSNYNKIRSLFRDGKTEESSAWKTTENTGWGKEECSYAASFIEREYNLFLENQKKVERKQLERRFQNAAFNQNASGSHGESLRQSATRHPVEAAHSRLDKFRKISFFSLLFICANLLFAEKYTFGGKKGWAEVTVRNGITTGKGRYGYEGLELASRGQSYSENTDLLLNFENSDSQDKSGNYETIQDNLFITKKSKMGKGAAQSRSKQGGITLSGNAGSFFSTEGPAGSFMIEFWLCPSVVENGEIILNWRSSRNFYGDIMYQLVSISFYQNRIMCTFSNIFEGYTQGDGIVSLTGDAPLVPGKWNHHLISYQEDTGELSYKMNGSLNDIKFITSTGHENGTIYQAVMGVPANVEICPKYTGLIDEIKITRSYEDFSKNIEQSATPLTSNRKYNSRGGRIESNPILTKNGTVMNSLTAEMFIPEESAVQLYIRGGDNYFSWTEDYPEWIPVKSGEPIRDLSGLYFQIAADLYPSGDGTQTPSITELVLDYTTLPEPQPPYKISCEKGDGFVTLTWSYSVDDTAGGYYVYYGTSPGEYLGSMALEGPSPINAGNKTRFTVSGLENGTIYYFAVSAWSKIDSRISGPLSKEVFARPEQKAKQSQTGSR